MDFGNCPRTFGGWLYCLFIQIGLSLGFLYGLYKNFLHLLVKHFPANNKMHEIFNKTVKISYSCIKNMDSIISGHNHNILHPKGKSCGCNYRKKYSCPLNGECLTSKVTHHADV